jgi:NTP pyrophosphatase (non-canonical NTP hydrolase)
MQIKEFQKLMADLYYERDKERGIYRTFMWLCEEIGELSKSLNRKDIKENFEDIGSEFADVFAWLCSLANIINLDLEEHSVKKYNYKCPKCKKNPCQCKIK